MDTSKQKLLDKEAKKIAACRVCKQNKTGLPVAGEGNPSAKVVFVGEAPGRTESETGKPFIGRSGKYLTQLIESLGITREDVYITSPVKYFPVTPTGAGRTPTPQEIEHGKLHFTKQMQIVKPEVIVLLGSTATKAFFEKPPKVMASHGQTSTVNGTKYFFTLHPAAAIRFVKNRKIIEGDFLLLKKLLTYV